jgi:hypothetical protein
MEPAVSVKNRDYDSGIIKNKFLGTLNENGNFTHSQADEK